MVNLSFILRVKSPLEPVWQYFSKFQNIAEWDPNVRKSAPIKIEPGFIGSDYQLTTVFNEKQSEVVYNMTGYDKFNKICLIGKNKMITAIDQIHFRDKGQITEIEYKADISLNGIYFLFTPFIRSGLDKLTVEAKQGMQKKCEELFGQTK